MLFLVFAWTSFSLHNFIHDFNVLFNVLIQFITQILGVRNYLLLADKFLVWLNKDYFELSHLLFHEGKFVTIFKVIY